MVKEINRNINKDYFFCYSQKLSKYLMSQGVGYITIAKDMNTDRVFSLYPKSTELQVALESYSHITK